MGHVVDGMATAVENADIIVVCISQNYFDSKNCKKELEYADELGKGFIFEIAAEFNFTGQFDNWFDLRFEVRFVQ